MGCTRGPEEVKPRLDTGHPSVDLLVNCICSLENSTNLSRQLRWATSACLPVLPVQCSAVPGTRAGPHQPAPHLRDMLRAIAGTGFMRTRCTCSPPTTRAGCASQWTLPDLYRCSRRRFVAAGANRQGSLQKHSVPLKSTNKKWICHLVSYGRKIISGVGKTV